MKVLVSVVSAGEVPACLDGGADIVDVKNIKEGSLGASFPWIIREIIKTLGGRQLVSAALGDLPFKPGTAALAAAGLAATGVDFVKAGVYGVGAVREGVVLMKAIARATREVGPNAKVIAAGYADYRCFNGLNPQSLLQVAAESEADYVMLDTAVKDGTSLFEALPPDEIAEFVVRSREAGLGVALAGSLRLSDIPNLLKLGPDVVGVRTAVCAGQNRTSQVSADACRSFVSAVRR